MKERSDVYLQKAKKREKLKNTYLKIATCLSLLVVLSVFWGLKLTGITLAGEAHCGKTEHTHNEECNVKTLICEIEESEEHTHLDECYEIAQCEIEEHIHIESCYSDITADIETEDDWEATLANITRSESTAQNVVSVAKSQLGYTESTLNFEIDENGVKRGITRYGQWYKNPYGDWSAMFVSFCLDYGGAGDVPYSAGAETMRLEWKDAGLYKDSTDYSPQVGNIVFLNSNGNATADSVAIITEIKDNLFTVIQGDYENEVKEVSYSVNGEKIVGYGLIKENSGIVALVEPPENSNSFAKTTNYNSSMLTSSNKFVFYVKNGDETFAINGSGQAVPIYINDNGNIFAETEDTDQLLWTFARYNNSSYSIQNVGSGRYLHPYYNSSTDNGITTPGRWGTTVAAQGTGVNFSHSAYIAFSAQNNSFSMTRTQNQNATFNIGVTSPCTVWFDGTNGGMMSLGGSDDTAVESYTNSTLTLPTTWKSPIKYDYTLNGWYDVTNAKYYEPGEKVIVTGNMVFYADWVASNYDIGQFNSFVDEDTVSTNSFVTTRVFDYNVLFNVLSEDVDVEVNSTSHHETWRLLTSGNNPYNNEQTLNFIFRDWDRGNEDISYPSNHNAPNNPTDAGEVYPGLYTEKIKDLLFNPDTKVIGKNYLGEADHLFQLCLDKTHDHYGYYYYNSERNAASFNKSDKRFYVYDYLECTRDSANNGENGKYSDFLPFNSPYANTNGKRINTYTYDGDDGKYTGTTHYMYDAKYNTENNSTNYVGTNYFFGLSLDVDFYLPNKPGTIVTDGKYGNQDIYGKDMHFRFAGDDDVWIFIDGKMVLDLGGLHGKESGDINFSTGTVSLNGVEQTAFSNVLKNLDAGEHQLTLYYLERGSSLSNCSIYFNLAPRFEFSIQKEDVLTKDVLNGAQFSVFTDAECTVPAELWTSKASHDNGDSATNVFTVVDGVAHMWGMGSGNRYYIKETKPPDNPDYGYSNGIICLTFDSDGTANYNVEIIEDENGISTGFMVHGFRIDTETQKAYIVATNAPKWAKETTSVEVMKKWNDSVSHTGQNVTVYLTVEDESGDITRLQEAVLNEENNWSATWDNLPKYSEDGKTLIKYGVEESYVSGYYSTVQEQEGQFEVYTSEWKSVATFENGKTYLLKNSSGQCLSTLQSAEDTGYKWVSTEEATSSSLALWTATVSGSRVRFTNKAGQTITFWYGNGSPTDFFALNQQLEDNNRKQYFTFTKTSSGFTLRYNNYYISTSLNSSQKFTYTTRSAQALVVTPFAEFQTTTTKPIKDKGFLVTNTPLQKETSLTVHKNWVVPPDMNQSIYEQEKVDIRLFANGVDTGRSVEVSLKNNWTATFKGLPYEDTNGNAIKYTVKETWYTDKWVVSYGEVTASNEQVPNYTTTVTNTYRTGGPILPSTGSCGRLVFIICGLGIMLGTLIYAIRYRRKRERRMK